MTPGQGTGVLKVSAARFVAYPRHQCSIASHPGYRGRRPKCRDGYLESRRALDWTSAFLTKVRCSSAIPSV